jgi:hypothetical protein
MTRNRPAVKATRAFVQITSCYSYNGRQSGGERRGGLQKDNDEHDCEDCQSLHNFLSTSASAATL